MRLCSAKPRLPFSPLALCSPEGNVGHGCLWLPGPCCFAGGLLRWKPTPMVCFFVEKQELAGKCRLDAGPSNSPGASYGAQHRGPISPTVQNTIPELHSGKFNSPRGTNHSRNAPLLSKATLAFFSPNPLVSRGQRRSGLPLSPWALLLCWWCPELEIHSKPLLIRG